MTNQENDNCILQTVKSCRGESSCTGVRAEGRTMGAEGRAEQQPAWTWQEQIMSDFSNFLLQLCEWKTSRRQQGGVCKKAFDVALRSVLTSRTCKYISKWNYKGLRHKAGWKCALCSDNEEDAVEPVIINYRRTENENAR